MKVPPGFESLLLRQKTGHPFGGVLFFRRQQGFENEIQAAGGSLVADGWTAAKQLFSAQQKMQTNPCCSAPPIERQFLVIKPSASGCIPKGY